MWSTHIRRRLERTSSRLALGRYVPRQAQDDSDESISALCHTPHANVIERAGVLPTVRAESGTRRRGCRYASKLLQSFRPSRACKPARAAHTRGGITTPEPAHRAVSPPHLQQRGAAAAIDQRCTLSSHLHSSVTRNLSVPASPSACRLLSVRRAAPSSWMQHR